MRRDIQSLACDTGSQVRLESQRVSPVDPLTGMARGVGRSSGELMSSAPQGADLVSSLLIADMSNELTRSVETELVSSLLIAD